MRPRVRDRGAAALGDGAVQQGCEFGALGVGQWCGPAGVAEPAAAVVLSDQDGLGCGDPAGDTADDGLCGDAGLQFLPSAATDAVGLVG